MPPGITDQSEESTGKAFYKITGYLHADQICRIVWLCKEFYKITGNFTQRILQNYSSYTAGLTDQTELLTVKNSVIVTVSLFEV